MGTTHMDTTIRTAIPTTGLIRIMATITGLTMGTAGIAITATIVTIAITGNKVT